MDIYDYTDTEPGYLTQVTYAQNGDRIIAEGCERYYLYPGTYQLTIHTDRANTGAYYRVYDKWGDQVIANKAYEDGSEQILTFTTEKMYAHISVQTLTENEHYDQEGLQIDWYVLESDGPACNDAAWRVFMITSLCILCYLGYKRAFHKEKPSFLVLTLASVAASLPFYTANLQNGHDIGFHMTRIGNIGWAMVNGCFPERMNTLAYGGPITPIMYPEMFLVGGGFMVATGATVMLAFKATCTVITFGAAYIAYYCARQLTDERTALFCALSWLFNPFRLNELLLRAELGEAPAIIFLPLIALGMWQIFHASAHKGAMHLIIGYTGLLACHLLTLVITASFCVIYVVAQFIVHPTRFVHEIRRIGWMVLAAVTTVLLNMYYLIPFLRYYGWNLYITSGADSYRGLQASSSPIWQIFMGAVGYGDGSMGTTQVRNEMPLSIGAALLLAVMGWIIYTAYRHNGQTDLDKAAWQAWGLGCCGVFMASLYFPWDFVSVNIPIVAQTLGKMQFSWRILMVPACLLSFLMGILVVRLLRDPSIVVRTVAIVMCVLLATNAVDVATNYYAMNNTAYKEHFDNPYSQNRDYVLADVIAQKGKDLSQWLNKDYLGPRALDGDEDVVITDYHRVGTGYMFSVSNTGDDAVVTVPVFWYGLHKAYLTDNKGMDAASNATEIVCNRNIDYQFSDVTIPAGTNDATVMLVYTEPISFRIAWVITGVTLAMLIGGWILTYGKRKVR